MGCGYLSLFTDFNILDFYVWGSHLGKCGMGNLLFFVMGFYSLINMRVDGRQLSVARVESRR